MHHRPTATVQLGLVALGAIVGALTQYTVDHDPDGNLSDTLTWLWGQANEWQTLLAGLVAIAAAWWTYRTAQQQIEGAREAEDRRIARERAATRMMLPGALEIAIGYTESIARYIMGSDDQPTIPKLDPEVLERISDCLRYEDDPATAAHLIELAEWIQIHGARVSTLADDSFVQTPISDADHVLDTAKLHKLIRGLFPYARQRLSHSDGMEATYDDVTHLLRVSNAEPTTEDEEILSWVRQKIQWREEKKAADAKAREAATSENPHRVTDKP